MRVKSLRGMGSPKKQKLQVWSNLFVPAGSEVIQHYVVRMPCTMFFRLEIALSGFGVLRVSKYSALSWIPHRKNF